MTEPYPPPTPEERALRAQRLGGAGGVGLAPGLAPPESGGFWRGRSAGLPNWAWVAGGVVIGAVVLIWYFRRDKSSGSSNSNADYTVVDDSAGLATGQYETITAQIRDLQGQNSQLIAAHQSTTPTPTTGGTVPTPPGPTTPAPATGTAYTIKSGDTLSSIATRYHTTVAALYQKNAAIIESAARAHGLSSSRGGPNKSLGWWIFPSTKLVV